MSMTSEQAAARLVSEWAMDPDHATRAVAIARDCGLKNEPVATGYITITHTRGAYACTAHASPVHKAAPDSAKHCNCGTCGQRIRQVPGGAGAVWVHADSGAVAAPDPSVPQPRPGGNRP
jgi:hypothetical protein